MRATSRRATTASTPRLRASRERPTPAAGTSSISSATPAAARPRSPWPRVIRTDCSASRCSSPPGPAPGSSARPSGRCGANSSSSMRCPRQTSSWPRSSGSSFALALPRLRRRLARPRPGWRSALPASARSCARSGRTTSTAGRCGDATSPSTTPSALSATLTSTARSPTGSRASSTTSRSRSSRSDTTSIRRTGRAGATRAFAAHALGSCETGAAVAHRLAARRADRRGRTGGQQHHEDHRQPGGECRAGGREADEARVEVQARLAPAERLLQHEGCDRDGRAPGR